MSPHEECGQPFVSFENRAEYPTPPIYATDLSRNVLQFANYGIDFAELDLIDPVSLRAIRHAKDKLYNLGALDDMDRITDVGKIMNKFPVGTECSRMIAEALKPGMSHNVLVNVMLIASAYEAGGLRSFTKKYEKGEEPWNRDARKVEDDAMLERNMFLSAGLENDEKQWRELRKKGYDTKNLLRARKAYRKCLHAIGQNPFLTPIYELDGEEMADVYHCVASGLVENIYVRSRSRAKSGARRYHSLTNDAAVSRELSNRTVVNPNLAAIVAGMLRYYMARGKDEDNRTIWNKYDIIENAQPLTPEQIQRLDLRETTFDTGLVVAGGALKVVVEHRAGGMRRGTSTRMSEVGEVDEGVMLKAVLENPGAAQGELKAIKKELENLQQLTRHRVNQLPQVEFENMLLRAIRQTDSTEFHAIDETLGRMMREQGIGKEKYIAPGLEAGIREAAVATLVIAGEEIRLRYNNGMPVAYTVSPSVLEKLPDEVVIPDGRVVLFRVPKHNEKDGRSAKGYRDVPAHVAKSDVLGARKVLV